MCSDNLLGLVLAVVVIVALIGILAYIIYQIIEDERKFKQSNADWHLEMERWRRESIERFERRQS